MHHSSMSWEISLLYFFSWNFIWFLQKQPTTVQNFILLTAQSKFHQIFTLIGYFCWKYIYKVSAKKIWKKYVSWYQRVVQNLKKNLFFVSKTRIWWILIRAIGSFCATKVYNLWPKKVQRSHISWHWRVMQNLKKN